MKKKLFVVIFLLVSLVSVFVGASTLVPYKNASGNLLKYRNTQVQVMIPEEYIEQESDFRAVWISHLVGDFPSYSSESQYKAEVQKVLDTLEFFNINAMIFHIRTHNNALYKSELNPVASYYSKVNFDVFDPLEYIIEEAHKRGIEFHAWMNPYRLSTSYSGTVEQYAATQPSYNIASNPEMILKSGNSLILNPGEPAVREFLVDTVMEVIENYDVDAIHFDDYFYISNVDDSHTRAKYNKENLSLGDFRRKQVDLFIKDLSNAMREYNIANNRAVQLGISPSGIYRNGSYVSLDKYTYDSNGNLTYPLGSNSSGFAHYDNYLYSDTKKWVDEEWIDYIIPQTYWSFEHTSAPYADLMDWWNMMIKNKNVNLYSGMGVYMAIENSSTFGWQTNEKEALNQVVYSSKLENVRGHSVYSYKHLRYAYDNNPGSNTKMQMLVNQLNKMKNEAWNKLTLLPEVRTYDSVVLPKVNNFKVELVNNKNVLSFNKVENAKFYAIYRSTDTITYSNDELIDIIGGSENVITYTDDTQGDFVYAVKPISVTNTLGEGVSATRSGIVYTVDFYADGKLIKSFRNDQEIVLPEIPHKVGYDQQAPYWSIQEFGEITENIRVDAVYIINKYNVDFYVNNQLFHREVVEHGKAASYPTQTPTLEGHIFNSWVSDSNLNKVLSHIRVDASFKPNNYVVEFIGLNNQVIKKEFVSYGQNATPPTVTGLDDYVLTGWSGDYTNVTSNLTIYGIFAPKYYTVKFYDKDDKLIKEETIEYGKDATAPTAPNIKGYKFVKWDKEYTNVTSDLEVYAVYEEAGWLSCKNMGLSILIMFFSYAFILFIRRRK